MEKIWNGNVYESYKIILDLIKGKGYMYSNYFKGEYLNGKRNWKWKEYYKGYLKFEGECLNWKNGMEKEKNIIKAI